MQQSRAGNAAVRIRLAQLSPAAANVLVMF